MQFVGENVPQLLGTLLHICVMSTVGVDATRALLTSCAPGVQSDRSLEDQFHRFSLTSEYNCSIFQ